MASTSLIPPQQHPPTNHSSELADSAESAEIVPQWPALNPDHNKNNKDSEWEIVGVPNTAPVVTFDPEALSKNPRNPKVLKHAQSSPDLRAFHVDDDSENDEETSSAVLVEDETSMASSSMDLVSEPPSVWSAGSNNKSFKDAILQKPSVSWSTTSTTTAPKQLKKVFKPKIVVVKPLSQKAAAGMRRPKSMGNLRSLDHILEDHTADEGGGAVLGETDAVDFYKRKEQGALGRKNGQKVRPDEAKRLEITMAKKTLQKQRQMQRG